MKQLSDILYNEGLRTAVDGKRSGSSSGTYKIPSLYTSQPVTPTASDDAAQFNVNLPEETAVANNPEETVGGVLSGAV